MYSPKVIERAIARYEHKSKHKLVRLTSAKRDDWRSHLEARVTKVAKGEEVEWTPEENSFIRNERVLSLLDFSYWCHYATIQRDGGGTCNFDHPWESTRLFLAFVAKIEQEQHDAIERGEMTKWMQPEQPKPAVPGILIAINKSRQLAATTVGRLITMHRVTLQAQRRALAASVDDDKIQEMYDRDKLCYDNLPFYLKPDLLYDEKRGHLHFDKLNSRVLYQVGSQKSGVGTGRQVDCHHLTELSTWINPGALKVDFFPAIPRSIHTFGLAESTPYGRGNFWHEWTENIRKGHTERWRYIYIPWYAEPAKYRALPPAGWQPSQVALLHAQKVYDTSSEFVGHSVMLSREQLWWWESTREEYRKDNKLNFFLTSYSATPEESFQHSTASAFDAEFLALLRDKVRPGQAYEIQQVTA